ncbi:MAG: helix-turn-helix transcriptional regulator [Victivallales bacterium]|nr:helix-turn-helix transcriptional regulator [Victivallales bacterium]
MQRKAIYRPTIEPVEFLPFSLRSVGHYIVGASYEENKTRKNFVQLFWCIKGEGRFVIDGREHLLREGQKCFYLPGDVHELSSACDEWNYRWLTIDGPMNTALVSGFGFRREPAYAGVCPEDLFLKLEREILDNTPRGRCMASATAYSIFASSAAGGRRDDPEPSLAERCVATIKDNFPDPAFDVNRLSEMLQVNRSSLSRIFHEEMQTTLKDYIVACRLQRALSVIKETSLPIARIAAMCGYGNPDYFAKAIRKASGFTPREFRRR